MTFCQSAGPKFHSSSTGQRFVCYAFSSVLLSVENCKKKKGWGILRDNFSQKRTIVPLDRARTNCILFMMTGKIYGQSFLILRKKWKTQTGRERMAAVMLNFLRFTICKPLPTMSTVGVCDISNGSVEFRVDLVSILPFTAHVCMVDETTSTIIA